MTQKEKLEFKKEFETRMKDRIVMIKGFRFTMPLDEYLEQENSRRTEK